MGPMGLPIPRSMKILMNASLLWEDKPKAISWIISNACLKGSGFGWLEKGAVGESENPIIASSPRPPLPPNLTLDQQLFKTGITQFHSF